MVTAGLASARAYVRAWIIVFVIESQVIIEKLKNVIINIITQDRFDFILCHAGRLTYLLTYLNLWLKGALSIFGEDILFRRILVYMSEQTK